MKPWRPTFAENSCAKLKKHNVLVIRNEPCSFSQMEPASVISVGARVPASCTVINVFVCWASCNLPHVLDPFFSSLAFGPLAFSSSQIHLSLSTHVAPVTNGREGGREGGGEEVHMHVMCGGREGWRNVRQSREKMKAVLGAAGRRWHQSRICEEVYKWQSICTNLFNMYWKYWLQFLEF